MKLNVKALAAAAAVLWGAVVLLAGAANMAWPSYGRGFLELLGGIYPGYDASGTVGDLIAGTLYAVVDGAIGGAVFGWLYNRFAGSPTRVPNPDDEGEKPLEP